MEQCDFDVVVVGAGVAGLAAAEVLIRNRLKVCIVESADRIGGRAFSVPFKNGSYFDMGCSYLHEGELNPFVNMARKYGFSLGDGNRFERNKLKLFFNGVAADEKTLNEFLTFADNCDSKIAKVALNRPIGLQENIDSVIDWNDKFAHLTAHLFTSLNASDVADQSIADHYSAGVGSDYPVIGGLGHLILSWSEYFLQDVTLRLNCPVSMIDWQDRVTKVHTSRGVCSAAVVLVTVSTGVINYGDINFVPCLPEDIYEGFFNLPCGTMNKIGLSFLEGTFDDSKTGWHAVSNSIDLLSVITGSFDVSIDDGQQASVFIGGSDAKDLECLGHKAAVAYGLAQLVEVFGSEIKAKVADVIVSEWGVNTNTRGSYSYARAGSIDPRSKLNSDLEGRVFFAGEACIKRHFGTCHGAYLSGLQTAKKIAKQLEKNGLS